MPGSRQLRVPMRRCPSNCSEQRQPGGHARPHSSIVPSSTHGQPCSAPRPFLLCAALRRGGLPEQQGDRPSQEARTTQPPPPGAQSSHLAGGCLLAGQPGGGGLPPAHRTLGRPSRGLTTACTLPPGPETPPAAEKQRARLKRTPGPSAHRLPGTQSMASPTPRPAFQVLLTPWANRRLGRGRARDLAMMPAEPPLRITPHSRRQGRKQQGRPLPKPGAHRPSTRPHSEL